VHDEASSNEHLLLNGTTYISKIKLRSCAGDIDVAIFGRFLDSDAELSTLQALIRDIAKPERPFITLNLPG
jgi:hypothetical protein